ncbi:carbohydrate sulfotransferase 1-like [Diadema antillarum]|uniref:carbohydrate sulfotransferase 1-like n=1 Tax=Diadema antillarum TaxID=105358 RepID=UPI003A886E92
MALYSRRRLPALLCSCLVFLSIYAIVTKFKHLDTLPTDRQSAILGDVVTYGNSVRSGNIPAEHGTQIQYWNAFSSLSSIRNFTTQGKKSSIDWTKREPLAKEKTFTGSNLAAFPSALFRPEFVVILAQMRTGSSVVGQIFNQNRDFFYLYEPLHIRNDWLAEGRSNADIEKAMSEVLRNISRCKFSPEFIRRFGAWGGRTKSRALMPLCRAKEDCMNLSPAVVEQICLSFNKRMAIKLIRGDIEQLKPLVENDGVNVKIVHLVRDPRGTANSRLEYNIVKNKERRGADKKQMPRLSVSSRNGNVFFNLEPSRKSVFEEQVAPGLPVLCRWMCSTLRTAQSKPAWLEGRYKLVRYEDFADRPVNVTRDIYEFLKVPPPSEVLEWVWSNTVDDEQDDELSRKPLFKMHKNASATASKWRLNLQPSEADYVQSVCAEAMRLFGYRQLAPSEIIFDTSLSLVEPLDLSLP